MAALIDRTGTINSLVDLGCGSGELTAALAEHLGATRAVGIDSSAAMLERAAAQASDTVRFQTGDISTWTGSDVDVIVANASLQWVPDHASVLERWVLGVVDPHVRLQVYPQVMASSAHVVEWTSGTSLTRFFKRLPDHLHQTFVEAYRDELLAAIGEQAPYFYAFKRVLLYGRRT